MSDGVPSRFGKYLIETELGRGAMGVVYKAFDPVIERPVAIKTVRKDLLTGTEADKQLARFRREAQAAGRINHPSIVAVYEYGDEDELSYIVMEYVDGRSLKDYFDEDYQFDVSMSVDLMAKLLDALSYSHDKGVIHRDIKPANIMISHDGQVKITDFGIARVESSTITQVGTVIGTPSYMSPEQFMGQTVDNRSDLYSAGMVLHQLLTGDRAFTGGLTAVMHKALNVIPEPPSALNVHVPPSLDAVVRKAVAKRPADRFETAAAFKAALIRAARGEPWDDIGGSDGLETVSLAPGVDTTETIVAGPRPGVRRGMAAAGRDPDGDRDQEATRVIPRRAGTASDVFAIPPSGRASDPVRKRGALALVAGLALILVAAIGGGAFLMMDGTGSSVPDAGDRQGSEIRTVEGVGPGAPKQRGIDAAALVGAEPAGLQVAGTGASGVTDPAPRVTTEPPEARPIEPTGDAARDSGGVTGSGGRQASLDAVEAGPAEQPQAGTAAELDSAPKEEQVAALPPDQTAGPLLSLLTTARGRTPRYTTAESMTVLLQAGPDRPAFVWCYYQMADGQLMRVFPNRWRSSPRIAPAALQTIPDANMRFAFTWDAPVEAERIRCFSAPRDLGAALPAELADTDLAVIAGFDNMDAVSAAFRAAYADVEEDTLTLTVTRP